MGFLTPRQRAALAASTAAGAPLSAFVSPPATDGKRRRVRRLADDERPAVRESAALSYDAPPDVLQRLAGDPVATVRACVARNPATTTDVLASLAGDVEGLVRGWVAAHPRVPADLVRALADDPDRQVRAVVRWADGWPSTGERR